MTALKVTGVDKTPMMAHVYGNLSHKYVEYTMLIGAAAADTIDFLRLPRDVRIVDFYETHDGANTAATTAKFGLAAVTGGPTTYVDDDYFLLAGVDLNAAGINRKNNTAVYPVVLDGEYYVRATLAGTAAAGANMKIGVFVAYEFVGSL